MKGNEYWRYTHFALSHDYGRVMGGRVSKMNSPDFTDFSSCALAIGFLHMHACRPCHRCMSLGFCGRIHRKHGRFIGHSGGEITTRWGWRAKFSMKDNALQVNSACFSSLMRHGHFSLAWGVVKDAEARSFWSTHFPVLTSEILESEGAVGDFHTKDFKNESCLTLLVSLPFRLTKLYIAS